MIKPLFSLTLFFTLMPHQLLPAQAPATAQMSRNETEMEQTFKAASRACSATCCAYGCCCLLCNEPMVGCAFAGWSLACSQISKVYQERIRARRIQEELQNIITDLEQGRAWSWPDEQFSR